MGGASDVGHLVANLATASVDMSGESMSFKNKMKEDIKQKIDIVDDNLLNDTMDIIFSKLLVKKIPYAGATLSGGANEDKELIEQSQEEVYYFIFNESNGVLTSNILKSLLRNISGIDELENIDIDSYTPLFITDDNKMYFKGDIQKLMGKSTPELKKLPPLFIKEFITFAFSLSGERTYSNSELEEVKSMFLTEQISKDDGDDDDDDELKELVDEMDNSEDVKGIGMGDLDEDIQLSSISVEDQIEGKSIPQKHKRTQLENMTLQELYMIIITLGELPNGWQDIVTLKRIEEIANTSKKNPDYNRHKNGFIDIIMKDNEFGVNIEEEFKEYIDKNRGVELDDPIDEGLKREQGNEELKKTVDRLQDTAEKWKVAETKGKVVTDDDDDGDEIFYDVSESESESESE